MARFRIAVLAVALLATGCSGLGYVAQLIEGQADLLNRARPLEAVLSDPEVRPQVREALEELARARAFASRALLLPDDGSYRTYAALNRSHAVWNVIATPPFSLQAKRWCFPVAGCVPYRGYFHEAKARAQAAKLAREGFDVYVAGARAYSTLGWFDDPIVDTMLYRDPALRVEILFHELAHRKLYVAGDGDFNEAFATFVAGEGTRRWLEHVGADRTVKTAYERRRRWRASFNALLRRTRQRLAGLYARDIPQSELRRQKRALFARLRREYAEWKRATGTDAWDAWMAQDLNNAHLALVGTYLDRVPAFARLLARCEKDLRCFYHQVENLAQTDAATRRSCLEAGKCPLVSR